MYEQMRNDFLAAFSNEQSVDVALALRVLDQVAMNYEIKLKRSEYNCFRGRTT